MLPEQAMSIALDASFSDAASKQLRLWQLFHSVLDFVLEVDPTHKNFLTKTDVLS